ARMTIHFQRLVQGRPRTYRWSGLALSLATAAFAAAVPAQTAQADAASALQACKAGAAPSTSRALSIAGTQWSTFYGHPDEVWPGDVLRVTASGSIKTGSWPWDPSYGPDGAASMPDSIYYPAQNQRRYSLTGLWSGQSTYFRIGRDSGCLQYTGAARTYLGLTINDDNPLDNSGSWAITVRHYWS
ncbi:hypothetical protein ACWC3X_42545, partial [Streptomyces populi]